MTWLDKDYKRPKKVSGYWNGFEEGANTFRILSEPIVGMEGWRDGADGKREVLRVKDEEPLLVSYDWNHFWGMIVWDYKNEKMRLMTIAKRTILDPLEVYVKHKKWGDPREYDITINREGVKFEDTTYTVVANPPGKLELEVKSLYEGCKIEIEALFNNGDPFKNVVAAEKKATEAKATEDDKPDPLADEGSELPF